MTNLERLMTIPKVDLALIVADLLDGQSAGYEIVENTGLPMERAYEISDIYNSVICPYAVEVWNSTF